MSLPRRLVGVSLLLFLPACGGGSPDGGGPAAGGACGRVAVPGHEAVDLRAEGAGCDIAEAVAREAEGRGRAPYSAEGFDCRPADAPAGDTDYTCSRDDARVSFRYGVA